MQTLSQIIMDPAHAKTIVLLQQGHSCDAREAAKILQQMLNAAAMAARSTRH